MAIKLVGHPMSTCTRRVAVIFKEKGIPFEFEPVDFAKGEHKSAEFLKSQPFGQVPYIIDDGFVLFESRAIGRYLATKFRAQGTPLIPDPADLKATALLDQAASIELSNFDPYASGIAFEKVFKTMRGGVTNEETVATYFATLKSKLAGYEAILSKQKYLAGNELTIVDLFHLPYGTMLGATGFPILESGEFPHVTKWWKEISARESWVAVKDGISV